MSETDYIDEIRQILQWIKDNAEFRDAFFADPEGMLAEVERRGYPLSERTKRHFLGRGRVTADNFEAEYARFFPAGVDRGSQWEWPTRELAEATPPSTPAEGPPERIVSTGFAAEDQPARPLDGRNPLEAGGATYYFWFEVGERVEGSIETTDVELPTDKLPPEAVLQVALFAFPGELEITPGTDVGEIKIMPDGTVVVERPAAEPSSLASDTLLGRRLFFPVRTPSRPGVYRLRCNVYYQQTLVQSRLITAHVGRMPETAGAPALKAEVDYTLSKALDANQLEGMGVNRLSMMLNDNGNGTHGFRFFGEGDFKNDATFDGQELQALVKMARGGMQKAAWGDEEPYQPGKNYRYISFDEARLKADLITLAIRGYRFYTTLIGRMAGGVEQAWDLADLMLKPGQVQIASKQNARLIIPVAMFYDYELNDGILASDYSICDTFLNALKTKEPLASTPCFQGDCPSRGNDTTICPSGFWGFRHSIGLPVSVKEADDAPTQIPSPGKPKIAVNVSTDPGFKERRKHEKQLETLGFDRQEYADSRDAALDLMKRTDSQVIYFYCHGGFANGVPFLSVGPVTGDWLTPPNLFQKKIRWKTVRPLVFVNGCHTTALEPEVALDFVNAFVATSNAAGVIGTEITIFEPIAVTFAEECLRRFLVERQTIGEAVRGARLKMLQDGNPLGLVYIPYVLPGLRLA